MTVKIKLLTKTQIQILKAFAIYGSGPNVAQALKKKTATVQTHCKNIQKRLGVRTMIEAVVFAFNCGWIKPDPSNVFETYELR